MQLLKDAILERGTVKNGDVLKVDAFLNHQMDIPLINAVGKTFYEHFQNQNITKILTIEASGIGIACITAQYFNVPVLFAKKTESRNLDGEVYTSRVTSFTKQRNYDVIVSKKFLTPADRILIIDDFLARGSALSGLINIIRQSGATIVGAGICIEKAYDEGGDKVRALGIKVHSLAKIEYMDENRIVFAD